MNLIITKSDSDFLKDKIDNKEAGLLELGKKLGDAMSRSGSFPASNPEYAAVHLDMKNVQNSLDFLRGILNKYDLTDE